MNFDMSCAEEQERVIEDIHKCINNKDWVYLVTLLKACDGLIFDKTFAALIDCVYLRGVNDGMCKCYESPNNKLD